MKELLLAAITGLLTGGGAVGLITYFVSRSDKKKEQASSEKQALRYIMLYIIQERAKELLTAGSVTIDELQSLRAWHDLYHDGLGGNGDADDLLERVKGLPIRMKDYERGE